MTVRMVLIGGFGSDDQAAPDDDGTEKIRDGFNGIGYQSVRMAGQPGHQFGCGQQAIDRQAEKGHSQPASEPLIEHGKL